jgi:hypothetical protein
MHTINLNKDYQAILMYCCRRSLSLLLINFLCGILPATAQKKEKEVRFTAVDSGWAANSVNAVVFRKNALVSFKDTQYISYYDKDRYVVLGKRKLGERNWQLRRTHYRGNAADAHNSISIMVDGAGYLHMAWDHHNNRLHYARSLHPGSLELTGELPMTGHLEEKVSYPEFYRLPGGHLLFFYRDGGSGRGNLVINRYDIANREWTQLHRSLIDGEKLRNAYWQACVDGQGTVHISWVWRESPDVASNHDLCYARSTDGGTTWERSIGSKYTLPITAASAEYALRIPQKSELINQTSMSADAAGRPFIASYWRDSASAVPQYRLVYMGRSGWQTNTLDFRTTPFSLSGGGTKRIPISRPQVMVSGKGRKASVVLIFRDEERGSKVSVAYREKIRSKRWQIRDLTAESVGSWEPSYDTELWSEKSILNLFVQKVEQVDAEGTANLPPQMIKVLEWKPGL